MSARLQNMKERLVKYLNIHPEESRHSLSDIWFGVAAHSRLHMGFGDRNFGEAALIIDELQQQLTEANRRVEELRESLEVLAIKMTAAEDLAETDEDGYDGYGAAIAIRAILKATATSKRGGE